MEKVTFIYCFRDREIERVKLSLDSLQEQTDRSFKVVFIDYGSELKLAQEVKNLVESYSFTKYYYSNTRCMMWNRSHALNTGIKLTDTEYFFTSDIDMIYKSGFVEMLNNSAKPDIAFFFSGIFLPNLVLPGNPIKELNYPKSSRDYLGWALIPMSAIKLINGFDETYCIWGKEDNDMWLRLGLAGIKLNYVAEIWMFHYYHPPVTHKTIPNDWYLFLTNYFDASAEKKIRNENGEWGKLLSDIERRTLYSLRNKNVFNSFNGRSRFFRYTLEQALDTALPGTEINIEVQDKVSSEYINSRIFKLAILLNRILQKIHIPILVTSKYNYLFEDIYSYQNEFLYMVVSRKNFIADYAYEVNGNTLRVSIIRK